MIFFCPSSLLVLSTPGSTGLQSPPTPTAGMGQGLPALGLSSWLTRFPSQGLTRRCRWSFLLSWGLPDASFSIYHDFRDRASGTMWVTHTFGFSTLKQQKQCVEGKYRAGSVSKENQPVAILVPIPHSINVVLWGYKGAPPGKNKKTFLEEGRKEERKKGRGKERNMVLAKILFSSWSPGFIS